MTQEYKFGEAIPAKEGKLWSGDPKVYALIVENERLREAVLAEREACAKLCDELRDEDGFEPYGTECAAAIRARGET
jgi:hypothetical protein